MNKQSIETKKKALENEFKKNLGTKNKAQEVFNQCNEAMIRLQGAYALLVEMEKELEKEQNPESNKQPEEKTKEEPKQGESAETVL